jgi:hypothetical protein
MKMSPVPAKIGILSLLFTSLVGCAQPAGRLFTASSGDETASGATLSADQIDRVGRRIWQNECGFSVAGLTSWNRGESFASLGIGHFIWYPEGQRGPFEESFPPLAAYLATRGHAVPGWMRMNCPWQSKAAFDADKNGAQQQELRVLLSRAVREQTEFIIQRMERALPMMLAQAADGKRRLVEENFRALLQTPEGTFCLIDYVNFKGEGTNQKERYQGQGWGLLQVLEMMPEFSKASRVSYFAESAKAVLSRRVANSPPERGEKRWLPGWRNRCESYKQKL